MQKTYSCTVVILGTSFKEMKNFLTSLLQAYFNNRSIDNNHMNKYLTEFLRMKNKSRAAQLVDHCGFDLLDTKRKLSILRTLLEAQLEDESKNKRIKQCLTALKPSQLRTEPMGRDGNGNRYWKFNDSVSSNRFIILKELVDDSGKTFFDLIRLQKQIHELIAHVSQTKVDRYCGGSQCKVERYQRDLVLCTRCKSKWHQDCLVDIDLHFDQDAWQCPHCDEEDLLETLRSMLREE